MTKKKARADLLADLRKQKIKSLRVSYIGSRDEGSIETIERYPRTSSSKRPVIICSTGREYAPLEEEYIDPAERIFYDILDDNFEGWEINDGGSGTIYWDMKNDTIKICHNQMVTESIYEEREGL